MVPKFYKILVLVSSICVYSIGNVNGQKKKNFLEDKRPELTFYGSGNIQKSLETGEAIPASTGLGVNYTHWFDTTSCKEKTPCKNLLWCYIDKLQLDASINVASTVDTIKVKYDANNAIMNSSAFGSSILTPLNSGQAVKIILRLDFLKPLFLNKTLIDGFKFKYVGSNRNWGVDVNDPRKVIGATSNYVRAGLFQEFLPKEFQDDCSINFGLYYAYNSIKGDVGQTSNNSIRTNILGTDKKQFSGPEVSLEIRLKNLRAEFGYSWLTKRTEVPGLTSGRLVTTISFVGGFGLKLDKDNKDNKDE